MNPRLFAFVAVLAIALCGCKETIFEAQPGSDVRPCDARLVGAWKFIEPENRAAANEDDLFVVVDEACNAFHFFEKKDGAYVEELDDERKMHFAFAAVKKKSILTVKIDEDKPGDASVAKWQIGYRYFLYEIHGKDIFFFPVDDQWVAQGIFNDTIAGRMEKISHVSGQRRNFEGDTLHNFVAGNAGDMAALVAKAELFDRKSRFILKPARAADLPEIKKVPAGP